MKQGLGILLDIVAHKRQEIEALQADVSLVCPPSVPSPQYAFEQALTAPGVQLITEIKPASPSAGVLQQDLNLDRILTAYNEYATAISVLTDEKYFQGSLDLLRQVKAHSPLPVLRKDFILDVRQVWEAANAHADAILLIVKILTDTQLQTLHAEALRLGLTPVVEVQNPEELARAIALHSLRVLLINNRNLETFEISLETTYSLCRLIPQPGPLVISASGIESREDIEGLLSSCRLFLIGSSLMRADDIAGKLASFHTAGPV